MFATVAKKLSYHSGLLGAYHRKRNRRTFTVVMFHRVLSKDDPRWPRADPRYTIETALFARCLEFFARHYNIVSLADVFAARDAFVRLPDRALLVTFDDGWADNASHALPVLEAMAVPAVVFISSAAVGRRLPFWPEQVDGAERAGRAPPPPCRDWKEVRGALSRMPEEARDAWLSRHAGTLDDGQRHMVGLEDLLALQRRGIDLALHGKHHRPLREAEDLDDELGGARVQLDAALRGIGAEPSRPALSFPHGSYDAAIAQRAREQGYALAFTSVPALNDIASGPSWLFARTGFVAADITDADGRFRPDLLGLYLFRRPAVRLA